MKLYIADILVVLLQSQVVSSSLAATQIKDISEDLRGFRRDPSQQGFYYDKVGDTDCVFKVNSYYFDLSKLHD